ncbi:MAG: hypothetical protein GX640_05705 [Fibrobacter sp.]|nr:hypothetical protein [Fibrobacter sp.]
MTLSAKSAVESLPFTRPDSKSEIPALITISIHAASITYYHLKGLIFTFASIADLG